MNFSFGCARELFAQGTHPRMLCDAGELAKLRAQVREGYGLRIMEAMREKVRPVIAEALAAEDTSALLDRSGVLAGTGMVLPFLGDTAMVGVLDEDAQALESVRRVLNAIPQASSRQGKDRSTLGYSHCGTFALAYDLVFPTMSAGEREAFARWMTDISVRQTLTTIRDEHYLRHPGRNIPMVGMMSALMALLAIEGDPGVPDLSAEKAELLHFFEATMNTNFGPEGYPAEDIAYGSGMACYLSPLVETTRRAGLYDAYTECPRYAKFGQAMVHFVQPWGGVTSNTGDYGADFGDSSLILPRIAGETGDPTVLWLHGTISYPIACAYPLDQSQRRLHSPELMLEEGYRVPVNLNSLLVLDELATPPAHPSTRPIPTQFMDSERGIVSFRDSWEPDATFVVFDGAHRTPAAQGHAHDSGGHFSLSALGEYFAIDTGRYSIEQEHHNVVIVDGKSGHVGDGSWKYSFYQANLTGYWPGDFVDSAEVTSSQMSDCIWARRNIMLVKGGEAPAYLWTVEDVNKYHDYHEFWWLLNVHPDSTIEIHGDSATVVGAYHGNLLDVHFGLLSPGQFDRPHVLTLDQHPQFAGSPKEYGGDQHRHAEEYRRLVGLLEWGPVFERPRLDAKVAGYNGRFMSLLLPRRKDDAPAQVEQLATLENGLAFRVTYPTVEDTLIWAYEHQILEAGDVNGRGQWCVVRRDRATGEVLHSILHAGTRLEVGGKALVKV